MPPFSPARLARLSVLLLDAVVIATGALLQAQTFNVIHTFTGGPDGYWPYAGVTVGPGGKLYGTVSDFAGPGAVFQMTKTNGSWVFSTLFNFPGNGSEGAVPLGRPVFSPSGALYGTTYEFGQGGFSCGDEGCGVVYSLRPPQTFCRSVSCPWSASLAYSFTNQGGDGGQPYYVDPAFDGEGNIYGTTLEGGSTGFGTVFKLTRSNGGWTESVILSFNGTNGGEPTSGVILDNAGNVFGTTLFGTVYRLTPSGSGWTETTLFNFPNPQIDGEGPLGPLLMDRAGNLYGTTESAGSGGGGTVFELTPSGGSWSYSVLYSFAGGNAGGPQGNLAMDGAGNLYGTTYADGSFGQGSVWKLTRTSNGWTYSDLHDFTGGADGGNPVAGPTLDASGNIYGTTLIGGIANSNCVGSSCGVVWEITH